MTTDKTTDKTTHETTDTTVDNASDGDHLSDPDHQLPVRLDDEASVHAGLEYLAGQGELVPGSLLLMLADADARIMCTVAVDDVPTDPPQHERATLLGPFLRQLRDRADVHGALLVIVRSGGPTVDGGDLAWHDAFAGASSVARLTSYGVHLATPYGVVRVGAGVPDAA